MWVPPACSTIRAAGRSSQPQSVDSVAARFGVQLAPAAGFHAIAQLTGSQVEYHRMDGFAVRGLKERFDVVLCFGILHRVTDPIAFLQTLSDLLAPGGGIVLVEIVDEVVVDGHPRIVA